MVPTFVVLFIFVNCPFHFEWLAPDTVVCLLLTLTQVKCICMCVRMGSFR